MRFRTEPDTRFVAPTRVDYICSSHFGVSVLMAAVAMSMGIIGAHAAAPQPRCGDTIVRDTTLHADLVNCPGNGLVIGADHVTVNLDGHTIRGNATPAETGADSGILSRGRRNVRVTGLGAIQAFDVGVRLEDTTHSVVQRIGATGNRVGVFLDGGRSDKVLAVDATRNEVAGVAAIGMSHVVRNNTADNNGPDGTGFFVGPGSDGVEVVNNTATGQDFAAVNVDNANHTVVTHNWLSANTNGVILVGSYNEITGNRITAGCAVACEFGISFEGGTGNSIIANFVEGQTRGGIRVESFQPDTPAAIDNIVRRNTVRRSFDGIAVAAEGPGQVRDTVVSRNRVELSEDDGIDVRSSATSIRGNRAKHNGDLGIFAVAGVTDGGTNRAAHNGNPAQCVNVRCR